MPSPTDLCNDALAQIGAGIISDIDDGNRPATTCKRFYDTARDQTLRQHIWNFALNRFSLGQNTTGPVYEWTNSYSLPPDCLRVVRLGTGADEIPFKVEGRNIVTDISPANLLYVRREDNLVVWDAIAYQAFSTMLASKLATAISHDSRMARNLYALYLDILSDAQDVDGQEGSPESLEVLTLTTLARQDF